MDETESPHPQSYELRLDRARNDLIEILSEIPLSHQDTFVLGHMLLMSDTITLEVLARTLKAARG